MKPYYQDKDITIYNGDCLEVMKELPPVDLVVTSPPYDNLRNYTGYSFDFKGIARELYKLTVDGGVVVWVVGDATIDGSETGTSFRQALYFKEIGFNLHDTMIYLKDVPPVNSGVRYENQFEFMFISTKGKLKTFNPIKNQKLYQDNRLKKKYLRNKNGEFGLGIPNKSKLKVIGNCWYYDVGGGKTTKDKIAFQHPAIFPDKLAEDHILSWSNEGNTILDPFLGSGTILVACKELGRKGIGIEISKEYCDIASTRLKNTVREMF